MYPHNTITSSKILNIIILIIKYLYMMVKSSRRLWGRWKPPSPGIRGLKEISKKKKKGDVRQC